VYMEFENKGYAAPFKHKTLNIMLRDTARSVVGSPRCSTREMSGDYLKRGRYDLWENRMFASNCKARCPSRIGQTHLRVTYVRNNDNSI